MSACSDDERTFEDSKRKGKGVTVVRAFLFPRADHVVNEEIYKKLIKILGIPVQ